MSFAGISKDAERADVIAYLRSLADEPGAAAGRLTAGPGHDGAADYREFEALAHRLADCAGEVQRRYFRTPVSVETKADASPVTIADREAEAAMRELIAAAYPDHGILGEEHGRDRVDAEFVWVLDPIDGTKSFITGRPLFGTLIALAHQGRPVLGMIDQSILRERWVGVGRRHRPPGTAGRSGCGACPGSRMRCCSRPARPCSGPAPENEAFDRVQRRVRLPMYGGDCYAYGLLAHGLCRPGRRGQPRSPTTSWRWCR